MSDLDPWDTRANPAQIRTSAEGLQRISGVLLGHGDNVSAVVNAVAMSFSEVIAADVVAQIGSNLAALETAVEATQYGFAVGSAWADDVESFKAARNELLYRWDLAEIDDFGAAPVPNLWPRPEPEDVERLFLEHRVAVNEARTAALRAFTLEGHALWEHFQDRVIEKGRMLREGPTPENLALVVSYLGWGAMTLWPEIAPPPVSAAQGSAAGATVIAGLDGAAGPQSVADALADVAAITRRAASGKPLTASEIDFLAAFYEALDQRTTEVPDYLARTSFDYTTSAPTSRADEDSPPAYTSHTVGALDPAMVGALTAASANGMLVLSRNGPGGGGYARLPTWIRGSLDDDSLLPPGVGTSQTVDGLAALVSFGEFLGHSDVEAGDGLSRELAMATSRMLTDLEVIEGELNSGLPTWIEQVDVTGQSFLEVVARNDGVCFDLVTEARMPGDYDAARFFTDMYCFEWSDDGAAAAGLTDFIPEWAGSADPDEQERSQVAMFDLVQIVTGDSNFSLLMDGVGRSGLAAESAVGQVNPAITRGFVMAMEPFMDQFAAPQSNELDPRGISDLTFETRVRFATLIGTDPVSATALSAAAHAYEQQQLADYAMTGDASLSGGNVGRIRGIVDAGIINAGIDAGADHIDAAATAARTRQMGTDIAQGIIDGIPVPGLSSVVDAVFAVVNGQTQDQSVGQNVLEAQSPPRSEDERRYDTVSNVLAALVSSGQIPEVALPVPFIGPTASPPTPEQLTDDLLSLAADHGCDLTPILERIESAYSDPDLADERDD